LFSPPRADTYDHANLVEWVGVGVWASHSSAPGWEAAFLKVCGGGDEALAMRKKAKELIEIYLTILGRISAAREVARLARTSS
jgi:hypothetical protein